MKVAGEHSEGRDTRRETGDPTPGQKGVWLPLQGWRFSAAQQLSNHHHANQMPVCELGRALGLLLRGPQGLHQHSRLGGRATALQPEQFKLTLVCGQTYRPEKETNTASAESLLRCKLRQVLGCFQEVTFRSMHLAQDKNWPSSHASRVL